MWDVRKWRKRFLFRQRLWVSTVWKAMWWSSNVILVAQNETSAMYRKYSRLGQCKRCTRILLSLNRAKKLILQCWFLTQCGMKESKINKKISCFAFGIFNWKICLILKEFKKFSNKRLQTAFVIRDWKSFTSLAFIENRWRNVPLGYMSIKDVWL